jgi:hypothetical protein
MSYNITSVHGMPCVVLFNDEQINFRMVSTLFKIEDNVPAMHYATRSFNFIILFVW